MAQFDMITVPRSRSVRLSTNMVPRTMWAGLAKKLHEVRISTIVGERKPTKMPRSSPASPRPHAVRGEVHRRPDKKCGELEGERDRDCGVRSRRDKPSTEAGSERQKQIERERRRSARPPCASNARARARSPWPVVPEERFTAAACTNGRSSSRRAASMAVRSSAPRARAQRSRASATADVRRMLRSPPAGRVRLRSSRVATHFPTGRTGTRGRRRSPSRAKRGQT